MNVTWHHCGVLVIFGAIYKMSLLTIYLFCQIIEPLKFTGKLNMFAYLCG